MRKLAPFLVSGATAALLAALVVTLSLSVSEGLETHSAARVDITYYPYHSQRFTALVQESYNHNRAGDASEFYAWMNSAYAHSTRRHPAKPGMSLEALLESQKRDLASVRTATAKAARERALAAWVHGMVKSTIPRFSLDRGFEFSNTQLHSERQCFLQSVLIAGLLQRMGADAGVVMVYKNISGEQINNGHAVTLLKLPTGRDVIVDASDPTPFAQQKGLFVRRGDYMYVDPTYSGSRPEIAYYQPAAGGRRIAARSVGTLDYDFIRSQFWYYRGERAPGGLLSATPTRQGLAASAKALETSVRICPQNPLALYMLGRAYLAQGNIDTARQALARANGLYRRFGWTPDGPKQYLALANRREAVGS